MPVDDLLAEFASAIAQAYRRVGPEDYFEGEYMVSGESMGDLLEHAIGSPFSNPQLEADIVGAFTADEEWCEANPYNLTHEEALLAGWQAFSKQVRTVTRYLFFRDDPSLDEVAAGEILSHIHRLIDEYDLLRVLDRNTSVFRARHSWGLNDEFLDASTLGPPTPEQALGASRMSSAGIPVFYGALDIATAVAETLAHAGAGGAKAQVKVSWGTFCTITEMTLVDLTSLPAIPGFFSPQRADREPLSFLHSFTSDVARPIPPDGREHSEYAPTQVVAEYLRHVYRTPEGHAVDGIIYPSSKTGGQSCVLFVEASEVCNYADWSGEDKPHKLFLQEDTVGCAVYSVQWKREPG